jgi:hypothetical protein
MRYPESNRKSVGHAAEMNEQCATEADQEGVRAILVSCPMERY